MRRRATHVLEEPDEPSTLSPEWRFMMARWVINLLDEIEDQNQLISVAGVDADVVRVAIGDAAYNAALAGTPVSVTIQMDPLI